MPVDVVMPALGMAQDTGTVLRWLKAEGDSVAKGEPLVEVETDKVTVEIEAPAEGVLGPVQAAEGDEVPVGRAIAFVLAPGEAVPEAAAPSPSTDAPAVAERAAVADLPSPSAQRRRLASPKARRLAAERGIEIEALAGSGPNGAVVAADVEATGAKHGELEVGSVWRLMAARTTQSWQEVPQFTLRRQVDASELRDRRAQAGPNVTYTDLLVEFVAAALRRHPRGNGSWRDGAIVVGEHVNVAIAVATDDGLVAPVIRDADRLDLSEIATRRAELVAAARDRRLRPEDVSGGTFTISNLGSHGIDSFDPIVNAPQAAILGVGRIVDRVVAVDGRAEVRPMLDLSVTFDHRVDDGARGAEFLFTLASLPETQSPPR